MVITYFSALGRICYLDKKTISITAYLTRTWNRFHTWMRDVTSNLDTKQPCQICLVLGQISSGHRLVIYISVSVMEDQSLLTNSVLKLLNITRYYQNILISRYYTNMSDITPKCLILPKYELMFAQDIPHLLPVC